MSTLNELHQETPAEITPTIRDALRHVSPSMSFFIDITPLPDCVRMFCYGNVDCCIEREGGCREEGWIVYEGWGGRYLKLIHHCLWRLPDGRLIDVTPSDERRNLFLPDSVRNHGDGVPARYIALDSTPEVAEIIAFCEDMDRQHKEWCRLVLGGKGKRKVRFGRSSKTQPIQRPDGSKSVGRNDLCPCRSGKKFKKCCLQKV
jgi:hypothetical protein